MSEKILFLDPNTDWTNTDIINKLMPESFDFKYIEAKNRKLLEEELPGTNYLITGWEADTIDLPLLKKAKNLRFIQMLGAGYENVDIQATEELGIMVSNTSGVNAVSVAEHIIMFLLVYYKKFVEAHNSLKKGIWNYKELQQKKIEKLEGKTVGLLGMGNVGKELVKRLNPFNIEKIYYDKFRLSIELEQELDIKYSSLDKLLKKSDILILMIPLTPETRNLITINELQIMKPSSIIINTARGGIIKPNDLISALKEEEIAGACLDCFIEEPIKANDPLLKLDNVLLTPHIAGATKDIFEDSLKIAIDNIYKVKNNEQPCNLVNDTDKGSSSN